jgi:hypothetical protein
MSSKKAKKKFIRNILKFLLCVLLVVALSVIISYIYQKYSNSVYIEDLETILYSRNDYSSKSGLNSNRHNQSNIDRNLKSPLVQTPILPIKSAPLSPVVSKAIEKSNITENPIVRKSTSIEIKGKIAWNDFLRLPQLHYDESDRNQFNVLNQTLKYCSNEIEFNLKKPMLSEEKFKWCQWALSSGGGGVQVLTRLADSMNVIIFISRDNLLN